MATTAYPTARYDFEIKSGSDIYMLRMTVKNPDDTDYSFTNLEDIELRIYDYNGGPLLVTRPESLTAGVKIASGNIIIWNDAWSDVDLPSLGDYYYAVVYEDSVKGTVKVVDGYISLK